MEKVIVNTANAPAAIGPYSQAVRVGNLLYTSGSIPIVPETGNVVEGGVEEQTKQAIENLKAIIEAAGSDLSKVIKTTVFIKDMNQFGKINEIYASYFTKNQPARSTVEVARLPKDVLVEIECIAIF